MGETEFTGLPGLTHSLSTDGERVGTQHIALWDKASDLHRYGSQPHLVSYFFEAVNIRSYANENFHLNGDGEDEDQKLERKGSLRLAINARHMSTSPQYNVSIEADGIVAIFANTKCSRVPSIGMRLTKSDDGNDHSRQCRGSSPLPKWTLVEERDATRRGKNADRSSDYLREPRREACDAVRNTEDGDDDGYGEDGDDDE
ncbi:unnamed protein product [Soboliphyme baturini]|uniref:SHSP domain-containing protein n=1 Tax=Soboliphyme baturini TaxID=241478 RepID=A0A183IS41_9BILA|nr:unnamed protein product [Soboliphyme baturini]